MRRPNLSAIQGWQSERRRALLLLKAQLQRAHAACHWDTWDALRFAIADVENSLRDNAQATIDEGVRMRWVHEVWPAARAAA